MGPFNMGNPGEFTMLELAEVCLPNFLSFVIRPCLDLRKCLDVVFFSEVFFYSFPSGIQQIHVVFLCKSLFCACV